MKGDHSRRDHEKVYYYNHDIGHDTTDCHTLVLVYLTQIMYTA